MSKHTSEPWEIWDQYITRTAKGRYKVICQWGSYTTEANANLIAAAPELLAALKAVMEAAEKWSPAIDQGRAAIAKAEGGS